MTPGSAPSDLVVLDMVSYQDLINGLPGTACNSGGNLDGLCLKIKNQSPSQTISSSCPTPTPTPPPQGCIQLHVEPWQCFNASRDFPAPFDPNNPTVFEGQHCDNTGFIIPCPDAAYNLDQLAPGGLGPLAEIWVDMSFLGATARVPDGGTSPSACFGSSFVGFDVLFREPGGDCSTPSTCDWQAGIRSAKDGPFVEVAAGTKFFVTPGDSGCPSGPTRCQATCSPIPPNTTCAIKWDWLANHDPNYPTLRFNQSGAAVKNWLLDERF